MWSFAFPQDLSHATMEMCTSIGRARSAKLVGKDLAEFYMRKKSPQKAEMYLQGALKNYLQTSSLLASDRHLTEEERKYFCQEILSFASQQTVSPGKTQF